MKDIVVGYDGSSEAERAVLRAAELAKGLSAHLVVMSVSNRPEALEPVETLAPVGPAVAAGTGVTPLMDEPLLPVAAETNLLPDTESAHLQLEEARRALMGHDVDAEFVAGEGDLADRLLALADERDADLIVVGSRGRGFLERLLARTVDEAVARHAERDVLLVH